uniref:Uncharacterized protein n=1 Tax=Macaca nemestrina TaxID=9545 RepID=A0A2K6CMQ0_MACNE
MLSFPGCPGRERLEDVAFLSGPLYVTIDSAYRCYISNRFEFVKKCVCMFWNWAKDKIKQLLTF